LLVVTELFAEGKQAVSCGADVRVWNVATGQCTATMAEHTKDVTTCSVSPNGTKILTGSADKTLKVWHLGSTDKAVETLKGHTSDVVECHFFNGDKKALSCAKDKVSAQTIRLICLCL
jgi:WD40 repeat protein